MQDFAPFTPEPQPYSNCTAQLLNLLRWLKGHFMLWWAIRLRNLGALLATYRLFLISTPV